MPELLCMNTIRGLAAFAIVALGILALGVACDKAGSEKDAGKSKFTCPMHHEVIQESPGKCPKCGMALEVKE